MSTILETERLNFVRFPVVMIGGDGYSRLEIGRSHHGAGRKVGLFDVTNVTFRAVLYREL